MKQANIRAAIIRHVALFLINLFITIQLTTTSGWSFLSILLAIFATREFVHGVRLIRIYLKFRDDDQNNQNQ